IGTTGTACENVIGSQDGLLCRARNVESFVASVRKALSEYDRWDSKGIAERARMGLSAEVVAGRYIDLFDRVARGQQERLSEQHLGGATGSSTAPERRIAAERAGACSTRRPAAGNSGFVAARTSADGLARPAGVDRA